MNLSSEILNCKTFDTFSKREKPFTVAKYAFSYPTVLDDKKFLEECIYKGKHLAKKVNPNAANNAYQSRNFERITNNCIAGVLSEFLWRHFLNQKGEIVSETMMQNVANQIDLKIIRNQKTIEVRSSFPRNGVRFAICHSRYEFDVIGPYSNGYKPQEIQKDYYVRVLYPFESKDLLTKITSDNLEVFLTGGVNWEMMSHDKIAIEKDFIPEDEMNINKIQQKTKYRVVPFSRALDTFEIASAIINE